ncbi:MAG: thiosulfate oxidation carrier protein SoxY [Gammaproteobacteria bacterium]|nr:thiosulfate oxidation carrier protein SoxY [Gammaproteobacteria bacterium]
MKRRKFLQSSVAGGALVVAAGSGLLKPSIAAAERSNETAFAATEADEAVKTLFGGMQAEDSGDITIKAPKQAENGAVVPIKVETSLAADTIAIVAEKNPFPLTTAVHLNGAKGFYSTRIKMGQTSNVVAYVKSGDKLYKASQTIKVTVGGCGG